MDENAVIEIICGRLETQGCDISQRLSTIDHGIDILAKNPRSGEEFIIEAKGGTSSRNGSARFGRPYTQSQVFDRVAKGVFTCIQLRARYPDRSKQHVILAVPETLWFRKYLEPLQTHLFEAGVEVWFAANKSLQPSRPRTGRPAELKR